MLFLFLLCILIGPGLDMAEALDRVLQQAQQQLEMLGYDPGVADGIYGPRTRQALEGFQRQQNLPVSGVLDAATLRALERAVTPVTEQPVDEAPRHTSPLQVVLHYLRLYDYYPAHVLPYVTAGFLGPMAPHEWIETTRSSLAAAGFSYQTWQVEGVEIEDDTATVLVRTRVQLEGQEVERQEIFTVVRTPEDGWFIDAWQTGPVSEHQEPAQAEAASPPGS